MLLMKNTFDVALLDVFDGPNAARSMSWLTVNMLTNSQFVPPNESVTPQEPRIPKNLSALFLLIALFRWCFVECV